MATNGPSWSLAIFPPSTESAHRFLTFVPYCEYALSQPLAQDLAVTSCGAEWNTWTVPLMVYGCRVVAEALSGSVCPRSLFEASLLEASFFSPGLCWLPLPLPRASNCILVGKWILYGSHSKHGPIGRRPTGRRPSGPFLLIETNAKSKARANHLVFCRDR